MALCLRAGFHQLDCAYELPKGFVKWTFWFGRSGMGLPFGISSNLQGSPTLRDQGPLLSKECLPAFAQKWQVISAHISHTAMPKVQVSGDAVYHLPREEENWNIWEPSQWRGDVQSGFEFRQAVPRVGALYHSMSSMLVSSLSRKGSVMAAALLAGRQSGSPSRLTSCSWLGWHRPGCPRHLSVKRNGCQHDVATLTMFQFIFFLIIGWRLWIICFYSKPTLEQMWAFPYDSLSSNILPCFPVLDKGCG